MSILRSVANGVGSGERCAEISGVALNKTSAIPSKLLQCHRTYRCLSKNESYQKA
jgi:hypothetical protein